MRVLKIAPPCQLQLHPVDASSSAEGEQIFAGLPEHARASVLVTLAGLIARSAMAEDRPAR